MKKYLISVLLVLSFSFSFAQNNDKYTKFLNKNPFLDGVEVYIDNPDLLNRKIFKTITEEYDLTSDGKKVYGDANSSHTKIFYYFFDKETRLYEKYFFVIQNEYIFLQNKYTYNYGDKECFIIEKDYETQEETKQLFQKKAIGNNESYKQLPSEYVITKEIQLFQNKKREIQQIYYGDPFVFDYEFDKDYCKLLMFYGEELQRTILFHKGREICNTQEGYEGENGKLVVTTEFNKNNTSGIIKTQVLINNKPIEESKTGKVTRKYNPLGFIEYEQIVPYDGKEGTYIIYSAEILDSEDEFLKKNIK